MIEPERIRTLNEHDIRARGHVLYWMQQSQRAEYNPALEYAIQEANRLDRRLLVVFGLMDDYPEANLRHYAFMLEGLKETQSALRKRGIGFAVHRGDPAEVAVTNSEEAALLVCDRGYLRHQKAWRAKVAEHVSCRVVQVEGDVVVPVDAVSGKREYAARTIRPKIQRELKRFMKPLAAGRVRHPSPRLRVKGLDLDDMAGTLERLKLDRSVPAVPQHFKGGTSVAKARFGRFVKARLAGYAAHRNLPGVDYISHMSPYLHFGQISPLYLALTVQRAARRVRANAATYLEELIVRRELSMNFVEHTSDYDRYSCLPSWASKTLKSHKNDRRPHTYSRRELESAQTHDRYWNAAMMEAKATGFMHNYMRMYWGKKILEWSATPEHAFRTTLQIMNRYFLDGRDANSYAGTGWIYGLHDRPWSERAIFGTVRYMSAGGLERKAYPDAYLDKVSRLAAE